MTGSTISELLTMAAPGACHSMLTLTDLNLTTTKRAFEQGKQAYGLQNYSQAVDFYTHALHLLRSEIESVILLHRANAYEMLSKYDRAAEDSKQANPTNNLTRPDPYLVLANTLLLQRRWHEATNIYKRGAIIVPNTYRQRTLLVDKYQQLTAFTRKYNQWIAGMLPYEVVSQILSYMPTTDRVQLASTCHFWRNFIHQQQQGASSLWHTIHIAEMTSSNPENMGPFLYTIAPEKPRTITLHRSDKDDMMVLHKVSQKILGIANDRRWDKLESLEAGDCGPGAPLEIILNRNQKSLTSLTLHTWVNSLILDQRDPLESAVLAAQICPNLRSLSQHFDARYIGDQLPSIPSVLSLGPSSSTTTTAKDLCLTKLVLRNGMDEDTGLVPLLQKSPQLTSFTLNSPKYRNCTRILTLLCEHCPKIQEFIYMGTSDSRLCSTYYTTQARGQPQQYEEQDSTISASFQPPQITTATTSSNTVTTIGIRKIKLKFWSMDLDTTMDDEPISSAFRKCHTTLETLELDMGTPLSSRYKCLDNLSLLGARCLQTLVLNLHDHKVGSETIIKLITASPALQTVDIQGSGFWHRHLFDALASLVNLQKLSIYQTHYGDDDDDDDDNNEDEKKEGIIKNGHWFAPVLKNGCSKLVDFTYRHNNSNEDTAFLLDLAPYIAQSPTLQKLNIQEIPIQSSDILSVILGHLVQSRTLDTLQVWLPFNEISESDMMLFTAIEKLTYLDIWDTSGAITKEMMHNVFQKLQKRDRFIFIRVDDPDTEHTVKGYTHGTSTIPLLRKADQNNHEEGENFVIEEYLGSDD